MKSTQSSRSGQKFFLQDHRISLPSGRAFRRGHRECDSGRAAIAPERGLHEERNQRAVEEVAGGKDPVHHLEQLLQLREAGDCLSHPAVPHQDLHQVPQSPKPGKSKMQWNRTLCNSSNPRFEPRTREVAHVHIMKGSGCSSSIGRTGGRQTVSLGSGCVYAGAFFSRWRHAKFACPPSPPPPPSWPLIQPIFTGVPFLEMYFQMCKHLY